MFILYCFMQVFGHGEGLFDLIQTEHANAIQKGLGLDLSPVDRANHCTTVPCNKMSPNSNEINPQIIQLSKNYFLPCFGFEESRCFDHLEGNNLSVRGQDIGHLNSISSTREVQMNT